MKTTVISTLLTLTFLLVGAGAATVSGQTRSGDVSINGVTISTDIRAAIERAAGARIPSGRYWYDPYCGAWGRQGGPTLGFGQAGIDFGAPMSANASNGHTRTFINGRELPYQDVAGLNALIAPRRVVPGHFWLDAYGNVGYEGGPALGNLVQIAQSKNGGGRKSSGYDSGIGSVMSDGNGFIGFISGSSSATRY